MFRLPMNITSKAILKPYTMGAQQIHSIAESMLLQLPTLQPLARMYVIADR